MKKSILVLIIYLIVLIATTFPLLLNFTTHIPGFFSSDESFAVLWTAWLTKFSLMNKLSLNFTDFIAYPFGIKLYSFFGFVYAAIGFLLSVLTTPVLVYNLQVIINIVLTAIITYLLVKYLINDKLCAIFSGLIFGFCPYMFVRSWQHIGAVYLWPIPLFMWLIMRLRQENTLKIKSLFIISFILSTVNFDVTYFLLVAFAAFLIYLSFDFKSNFGYIRRIFFLTSIAFAILLFQFLPVIYNVIFNSNTIPSAQNIFHRPFEDLFTQSSRPLSYFLPSVAHPLFGKFTEQFVGTNLYGRSFTEHTLYLGWIPLILAFTALRRWRKAPADERFYIGFLGLLALVAWFFSQPPWWSIFGLKIYMPSFFMYKVLPMVRAYCRFGVVVMFAVSVLAGFGLKFILEKSKSNKAKIAITTLVCVLVLFEFWSWPQYKVIDVSTVPAVYYWLKGQPEKVVIAEYPLDINGSNELYKLYQTKHEKRMVNATITGTYANSIARTIARLSEPRSAGVLKWLGVTYAIVHRVAYLKTELTEDKEDLGRIPANPGLKFLRSFPTQECPDKNIRCIKETGPIDVYEVTAVAIKPQLMEK
jgi:hypothetical protein